MLKTKTKNKMQHEITGVERLNPNNYGGMCSRAFAVKKEVDFEKGIDTVATTSAPALVVDWERWQVIREVLPMKYAQLPKGDKVPLLDSHMRGSVDRIKGSATNWTKNDSELMAKIFVSESEDDIKQKIKEGHIDSVSIGYNTDSGKSVEIPKGQTVTIDGAAYKNDFTDDYPMVVRLWWETKELSLVPIGADDAAKFRSVSDFTAQRFMKELSDLRKELEALKTKNISDQNIKSRLSRRLQLINLKHKQQ